jgi:hypothetical protein
LISPSSLSPLCLPSPPYTQLHYGDVRKLHPDELLKAFSFRPHELPRISGGLQAQYEAVCQTVCVNVFEAIAAEALAAIGKPGPRDELYERLRRDESIDLAAAGGGGGVPEWVEVRISPHGLPFFKYKPLGGDRGKAAAECALDDALSEYELSVRASILENHEFLKTIGLM